MEWQDEGVVLVARRHGETAAVAALLTRGHGRHAGLVRGGAGRKARPIWQTGNRLGVTWRARLPEHLGAYTAEPVRLYAADVLDDPARLAGLSSACALIDARLPERDPHPALYD
ncbi:MAG TPA: DNA repair protein RecO, partial [Geminicoccaceae bacterium]|nr:DNA repair protein RecO [Geminicoccaceae bacterium]